MEVSLTANVKQIQCTGLEIQRLKFVAHCRLGLNERKPHSKYVILLRAHAEMRWSLDLILSMRALVREAYDSGWHTWILMQVDLEYLTHNSPSLAESCLYYELIHNLGLHFLLVNALIASGTALHDMTSLFHSVGMAALKL